MIKFAVVAILAALVTPASARFEPPERYNHIYRGRLIVIQQPLHVLRRICGYPDCWGWTYGDEGGRCTIYLPLRKQVSRTFYDQIYTHERAHCNGWSPRHEP
jgi:hypothetical protein